MHEQRISALSSVIDSFDPSQVGTAEVRGQILNLKMTVIEELNLFHDYRRQLNVMPAYFILQGIIFIVTSSTIYFMIPKEERETGASKKSTARVRKWIRTYFTQFGTRDVFCIG